MACWPIFPGWKAVRFVPGVVIVVVGDVLSTENVVEAMDRYRCHNKVKVPNVQVVDSVDSGFMELFEKQKKNPLTEGVVLKHGDSKLIGNMGRPQDNKLWKKVKYRE